MGICLHVRRKYAGLSPLDTCNLDYSVTAESSLAREEDNVLLLATEEREDPLPWV